MTLYLRGFFFSSSDFGKFKILDEYILSKNIYVFTVLDSNNCDLPRHAVMQSFKSVSVSVQCSFLVSFFMRWFIRCCVLPRNPCKSVHMSASWSLISSYNEWGYIVSSYSYTKKKGIWSLRSHFQTLVVLLPLWAIFRTLASDLCPCVTIAFGVFFFELCWALLVIPHTARLSVLNCVIILDFPSLAPFLTDICRFKWNVSPREAILVKVYILQRGKPFFEIFFGPVSPVYFQYQVAP